MSIRCFPAGKIICSPYTYAEWEFVCCGNNFFLSKCPYPHNNTKTPMLAARNSFLDHIVSQKKVFCGPLPSLSGEKDETLFSQGEIILFPPPPPSYFPLECRSIHLVTVYFSRHVCTFLVFFGRGESNSCSIGQINGWWCGGEGGNAFGWLHFLPFTYHM